MNDKESDWIFYLKLSKKLPLHFFSLSEKFSARGITLVPITLSELTSVNQGDGRFHVITCVRSISDAEYYAKKVQKTFSYLLHSRRMSLFMASSFSLVDDTHIFGRTKQYFFYSLPVELGLMCDTIAEEIYKVDSSERKWPGASRGLGSTVG